ncbi:MAG TPA: sulfatase-like hydrolase/transferase, partial [Anaerolineales bacterium]|nr:sulfatase-like hydrolase/transferase [Anaerolineales bacterium]
ALYPILELRNHNITYVDAVSLVRPVIISVLLTGLIWIVFRLLFRDWQKSGIMTTLVMIAFFTYGQVFIELESTLGEPVRHRYLALLYAGILVLLAILILWKVRRPNTFVNFLTITGGVLTLFSVIRMLQHDLSIYQAARLSNTAQSSLIQTVSSTTGVRKPDIYLILLDAHTSVRTMKEEFHYDASAFQQQLESLGFYVAECAQSNYPITNLSVTSAFYANYHQEPTLYPIYSSLVIETLRSEGYRVITFENRSNGHFDIGEDLRLSRNQTLLNGVDLTGGLSEFEVMLWKTSFARIAYDMPQLIPAFNVESLHQWEYYEHYQQTYFMLDELKRLPDMEGSKPKFVFAHFLVPHPPFIFAPDGKFAWAESQAQGYASNAKFIDSQIVPVVAEIIRKSKTPPVIIIMGDHGATGVPKLETPQRRMSILDAYYVNEQAKKDLYETITPVNTFRVIFNNYFGTTYPYLEDKSYHASNMRKFTPENMIPNTCQVSP